MLYKKGRVVAKDMKTTVSYFATASFKGREVSMVKLSECLYHDHGFECNFEKAFQYSSEAERRGAVKGYRCLGDFLADGSGAKKKNNLAVYC